jgi:DNA-binding winged helix-turn-helix (wHTH) protein
MTKTTSRRTVAGGRIMEERIPGGVPHLDELGVLHTDRGWVSLGPVQEAIVRTLLEHFGEPVSRGTLEAAVWPDGGRDAHTIHIHIHRLRPRLGELGLVVHTLRGRGFLLENARA